MGYVSVIIVALDFDWLWLWFVGWLCPAGYPYNCAYGGQYDGRRLARTKTRLNYDHTSDQDDKDTDLRKGNDGWVRGLGFTARMYYG